LEQHPDDNIVTKHRLGAFLGADCQRGATQVVLTGVATSSGVESTARSAYDLGYNVTLVVDAMTDRDAHPHRHSVVKIFSRRGETELAKRLWSETERLTGARFAMNQE